MCFQKIKSLPNVKRTGEREMNHWFFNKLAMVALITGLVIASAAGAVFAGSSEQKAKIDLIGTGAPGATGEAELQIRQGEFEFEAKVEDLTAGGDVSFCLKPIGLAIILIDTENVEDQGRVELDEDDPADLFPTGVPGTILGVVTIREGTNCTGTVLLQGTVSSSDLE